jgi:2-C-methyl-D-erythritol 2,4-cyclodiphosphate synthase
MTRVGYGEDAHALTPGRPLVLGNVFIESERGARAHSDGDALLHALADAILSAVALGDIGDYFPPSDPAYRNLDSAVIVQRALALARDAGPGLRLINVAAVVTLDAPKLGPHRDAVRRRVAELLGVVPEQVGLTFKTSEGLAPDHVQARATVLLDSRG